MDKHLNLFHHYSQKGSIPIENNVSRGFAINLQENPGLLYLFLDLLKSYGCDISMPIDSYEVGFQMKCSEFPDANYIVGVSLTARELSSDYDILRSELTTKYNPITDISIMYEDTLIIIEVKRDGTDCRKQLDEQIQKYKAFKSGFKDEINEFRVDLSWDKIMTLIDRHIKLSAGKANRILMDYYLEIVNQFPAWAPKMPLGKLSSVEVERINQRIDRIKVIYQKTYSPDSNLRYGRGAIPINYEWATEYNIDFQSDFLDENGNRGKYLTMSVWPSDTCTQYWTLKKKVKSFAFFSKRYADIILSNGDVVKVRIFPYFKFCNWNKGVMWLFGNEENNNKIDNLLH